MTTHSKQAHQTPVIEARNVSKAFSSKPNGNSLEVVRDFSLRLYEGDLVTMFGPNGCGKTTVLNILSGMTEPDSGLVLRNTSKTESLDVGYVFQNYADTLLPWRNVQGNIAFPLELRHVPSDEQASLVQRRLEQFHLMEHADKYIYELSGGLKQLVSIARATVYDPRLLLLDEPFSALDYSLSRTFWLRFREFWSDQRVTTAFVSHNIDEAVFLGDRIYVMSPRPARIVAEIPVPFGRDRPLSLLSSTEFFAVRTQVLDAFEQGRSTI